MSESAKLLAVAVTACAFGCSTQAPGSHERPSYVLRADTMPEPKLGFVTSRAAEAMALTPLHRVVLPRGIEEIRIWTELGLMIPHQMVRIVRQGDQAAGQVYYWLERAPDAASGFPELLADLLHLSGSFGCQDAGGPDSNWEERIDKRYTEEELWYTACRRDLEAGTVQWLSVWKQLRRNRIFSLPDASTLSPPEFPVLDGMALQVELLSGSHYRSYVYNSPDLQPWKEAQFADSIVRVALSLGRWERS